MCLSGCYGENVLVCGQRGNWDTSEEDMVVIQVRDVGTHLDPQG